MYKQLTVKDILNITNGKLVQGSPNIECGEFVHDTRQIKKDNVFIGINSTKTDGSYYWEDAFEKGCSVAIINPINIETRQISKWKNHNLITVTDTKQALHQIAKFKRNLYGNNLKVIAITGSVGKTSTKDMIANVLSQQYKTLKTIGNYNNDIRTSINFITSKR